MKNLSRVVWSEGMYVGPHHFQAQNRYFEDTIQFSTANVWYQPFGFCGYNLDAEALSNGTVALTHARGVFPDGLSFHMPEFDEIPGPRRIAEIFPAMQDSVDILLVVPELRPDGLNCAMSEEDSPFPVRYFAEEKPLPDENTGRDVKMIQLGRKNVRLLLSTEKTDGMAVLPLARVRRQGTGQFLYDQHFFPPCLQISACAPLMAMVRQLIDVLEEKCRTVAHPKQLGARPVSGFSADGIANAWFLHCLNSSLGPLRHLCVSKRAHPEEVYVELSGLAGALCTFSFDSQPSSLPLYDHLHLAECMEALDKHIRAHLELIVPSNCIEIPLTQSSQFFYEARIVDERTLNRSRWILAIRCAIGEAELIESTGRLVKLCAKDFVQRLVERALSGLKLSHIPAPPPALSPKLDFQYFAIDKAGPCWERLVKTREVGIYVPGELPDPEIELSVLLES
jgi:type VI secretion system protein ImpJ